MSDPHPVNPGHAAPVADETPVTARQPAPGSLRTVQDFVNSADLEQKTDDLASPEQAAGWLCTHGLCAEPLCLSWADRERLIALREAVRALLYANGGEALDAAAVELVEREAARLPLGLRVGVGAITVVPVRGGFDGALAGLLAAVTEANAEGTWCRLKACRDRSCAWAFYDQSRNASGVWCTMADCGNRAKARRFRERHPRLP